MPYTGKRVMKTAIAKQEIELLGAGFNYTEISRITGTKRDTLHERNKCFYKIDIWDAFRKRIEREGIPNRLRITDDFGYWFTGLVDGEGCLFFNIYLRKTRFVYPEFETGFSISLREDDMSTLWHIKNNLGVGTVIRKERLSSAGNPQSVYRVYSNKDLAEILIPLFDRYPLRTKKAKEFPIWREAILRRYIFTLGGYANRKHTSQEEYSILQNLAKQLRAIRAYH